MATRSTYRVAVELGDDVAVVESDADVLNGADLSKQLEAEKLQKEKDQRALDNEVKLKTNLVVTATGAQADNERLQEEKERLQQEKERLQQEKERLQKSLDAQRLKNEIARKEILLMRKLLEDAKKDAATNQQSADRVEELEAQIKELQAQIVLSPEELQIEEQIGRMRDFEKMEMAERLEDEYALTPSYLRRKNKRDKKALLQDFDAVNALLEAKFETPAQQLPAVKVAILKDLEALANTPAPDPEIAIVGEKRWDQAKFIVEGSDDKQIKAQIDRLEIEYLIMNLKKSEGQLNMDYAYCLAYLKFGGLTGPQVKKVEEIIAAIQEQLKNPAPFPTTDNLKVDDKLMEEVRAEIATMSFENINFVVRVILRDYLSSKTLIRPKNKDLFRSYAICLALLENDKVTAAEKNELKLAILKIREYLESPAVEFERQLEGDIESRKKFINEYEAKNGKVTNGFGGYESMTVWKAKKEVEFLNWKLSRLRSGKPTEPTEQEQAIYDRIDEIVNTIEKYEQENAEVKGPSEEVSKSKIWILKLELVKLTEQMADIASGVAPRKHIYPIVEAARKLLGDKILAVRKSTFSTISIENQKKLWNGLVSKYSGTNNSEFDETSLKNDLGFAIAIIDDDSWGEDRFKLVDVVKVIMARLPAQEATQEAVVAVQEAALVTKAKGMVDEEKLDEYRTNLGRLPETVKPRMVENYVNRYSINDNVSEKEMKENLGRVIVLYESNVTENEKLQLLQLMEKIMEDLNNKPANKEVNLNEAIRRRREDISESEYEAGAITGMSDNEGPAPPKKSNVAAMAAVQEEGAGEEQKVSLDDEEATQVPPSQIPVPSQVPVAAEPVQPAQPPPPTLPTQAMPAGPVDVATMARRSVVLSQELRKKGPSSKKNDDKGSSNNEEINPMELARQAQEEMNKKNKKVATNPSDEEKKAAAAAKRAAEAEKKAALAKEPLWVARRQFRRKNQKYLVIRNGATTPKALTDYAMLISGQFAAIMRFLKNNDLLAINAKQYQEFYIEVLLFCSRYLNLNLPHSDIVYDQIFNGQEESRNLLLQNASFMQLKNQKGQPTNDFKIKLMVAGFFLGNDTVFDYYEKNSIDATSEKLYLLCQQAVVQEILKIIEVLNEPKYRLSFMFSTWSLQTTVAKLKESYGPGYFISYRDLVKARVPMFVFRNEIFKNYAIAVSAVEFLREVYTNLDQQETRKLENYCRETTEHAVEFFLRENSLEKMDFVPVGDLYCICASYRRVKPEFYNYPLEGKTFCYFFRNVLELEIKKKIEWYNKKQPSSKLQIIAINKIFDFKQLMQSPPMFPVYKVDGKIDDVLEPYPDMLLTGKPQPSSKGSVRANIEKFNENQTAPPPLPPATMPVPEVLNGASSNRSTANFRTAGNIAVDKPVPQSADQRSVALADVESSESTISPAPPLPDNKTIYEFQEDPTTKKSISDLASNYGTPKPIQRPPYGSVPTGIPEDFLDTETVVSEMPYTAKEIEEVFKLLALDSASVMNDPTITHVTTTTAPVTTGVPTFVAVQAPAAPTFVAPPPVPMPKTAQQRAVRPPVVNTAVAAPRAVPPVAAPVLKPVAVSSSEDEDDIEEEYIPVEASATGLPGTERPFIALERARIKIDLFVQNNGALKDLPGANWIYNSTQLHKYIYDFYYVQNTDLRLAVKNPFVFFHMLKFPQNYKNVLLPEHKNDYDFLDPSKNTFMSNYNYEKANSKSFDRAPVPRNKKTPGLMPQQPTRQQATIQQPIRAAPPAIPARPLAVQRAALNPVVNVPVTSGVPVATITTTTTTAPVPVVTVTSGNATVAVTTGIPTVPAPPVNIARAGGRSRRGTSDDEGYGTAASNSRNSAKDAIEAITAGVTNDQASSRGSNKQSGSSNKPSRLSNKGSQAAIPVADVYDDEISATDVKSALGAEFEVEVGNMTISQAFAKNQVFSLLLTKLLNKNKEKSDNPLEQIFYADQAFTQFSQDICKNDNPDIQQSNKLGLDSLMESIYFQFFYEKVDDPDYLSTRDRYFKYYESKAWTEDIANLTIPVDLDGSCLYSSVFMSYKYFENENNKPITTIAEQNKTLIGFASTLANRDPPTQAEIDTALTVSDITLNEALYNYSADAKVIEEFKERALQTGKIYYLDLFDNIVNYCEKTKTYTYVLVLWELFFFSNMFSVLFEHYFDVFEKYQIFRNKYIKKYKVDAVLDISRVEFPEYVTTAYILPDDPWDQNSKFVTVYLLDFLFRLFKDLLEDLKIAINEAGGTAVWGGGPSLQILATHTNRVIARFVNNSQTGGVNLRSIYFPLVNSLTWKEYIPAPKDDRAIAFPISVRFNGSNHYEGVSPMIYYKLGKVKPLSWTAAVVSRFTSRASAGGAANPNPQGKPLPPFLAAIAGAAANLKEVPVATPVGDIGASAPTMNPVMAEMRTAKLKPTPAQQAREKASNKA